MSGSDTEMYGENSSEIARAEISSTTEEITSIEGKDRRKEAKRALRRISGFTGAPIAVLF